MTAIPLEWALPDQLVFATVSALLRIAGKHPEHRESAICAIIHFVCRIVSMLKLSNCMSGGHIIGVSIDVYYLGSDILAQYAPSFHGFYRAIISIPFTWTLQEWTSLSAHLNDLFEPEVVEGLNRLLLDVIKAENEDPDKLHFVQTLLARYVSRGRPLSGYFTVCCVVEAQWTTLAQALAPSHTLTTLGYPDFAEAAAANKAWQILLQHAVDDPSIQDESYKEVLDSTMRNAMQTFSNLLVQIEEMETVPSEDSYAWETMSESLVSRSRS